MPAAAAAAAAAAVGMQGAARPVLLPTDLANWQQLRRLLAALRRCEQSVATLVKLLRSLQAEFASNFGLSYRRPRSAFAGLGRFLETCLRPADRSRFFANTLPFIAERVLALEHNRRTLNYSLQQRPVAAVLSRDFVSSLVAAAFLCLLPPHPEELRDSLSDNSFEQLFDSISSSSGQQSEKLLCVLNYFDTLLERGVADQQHQLVVVRAVLPDWRRLTDERLAACELPLCPLLTDTDAPIQQADASLMRVNFGSCFLGGDVLRTGLLQEEANFCLSPELMVTQFFVQSLDSNEAVYVLGYEQFSKYCGSGSAFRFGGRTAAPAPGSESLRLVSIDAMQFVWCQRDQYYQCSLLREVNKALVGFCQQFEHIPVQEAPAAPTSLLEEATLATRDANARSCTNEEELLGDLDDDADYRCWVESLEKAPAAEAASGVGGVADQLASAVVREAATEAASAVRQQQQQQQKQQQQEQHRWRPCRRRRSLFLVGVGGGDDGDGGGGGSGSGGGGASATLATDACDNLTEAPERRIRRLADAVSAEAVRAAGLCCLHAAACARLLRRPPASARDVVAGLAVVEAVDSFAERLLLDTLAVAATEAAGVCRDASRCPPLADAQPRGVATGNWGCGSHGGDPQLKFALQWLAASVCQVPVFQYHTFGSSRLAELDEMTCRLVRSGATVRRLWQQVLAYCDVAVRECERADKPSTDLFSFLLAQL